MPDFPLKVEVTEDNVLTISIGADQLASAMKHSPTEGIMEYKDDTDEYFGLNVVDPVEFAKELANQMQKEEEDGDTPLHQFFDQCVLDGLNGGNFMSVDLDNPILQD